MPAVPQIGSPTSSRKQAEGAVLATALVVLVLYAYRKLLEPATLNPKTVEPAIAQVIGTEPKPAPIERFAVAYGFVFFTLSVTALAAPELATAFAILVGVGYTLTNGSSVFLDITRQVGGATGGAPLSTLISRRPTPAGSLPTLKTLPTPPVNFAEVRQLQEQREGKR